MTERRKSRVVFLGNVPIGGGNPITVQSMTNVPTSDGEKLLEQIRELIVAGCDIVRVSVPDEVSLETLKRVKPEIKIPVVADIHYDYKLAVKSAEFVEGVRINPGNIGAVWKVREVARACSDNGVPIRVGVNAGSLDRKKYPQETYKAMVMSALDEVEVLESVGFSAIKVSLKSSSVEETVEANRAFASITDYPIHLGVTEAGPYEQAVVKSSVGIGTLLMEGIGDTLRVSITGDPVDEVKVGKAVLKSAGLIEEGLEIVSCPTCARTDPDELLKMVKEVQTAFEGVKRNLKIAVMGCVVNGPGEARSADYGIALSERKAVIFAKGEIIRTVDKASAVEELIRVIEDMEGELR